MVNSDDKYLLPVKEFPKNQADIESLILRRIGEYPKIEVGGLLMTNSYEFREIRYCTGDKHNIDPDTCKYIFEVDEEQFHKIVYFLSCNFIKKEQEEYKKRFLSEVEERGLYNRFAELVEQNPDLDFFDRNFDDEELNKIKVERPKEFDPYENLVNIDYHSHPKRSLKPSRTDIKSAQNDDASSKVLYVIAGKGRCKWYELRFPYDV